MWIFLLIVLAVVVYFVLSQASNSNQASKASSQNYTNQVDYSNLEITSLDSSVSDHYNYRHLRDLLAEGKWREADEETGRLMFAVGYLTAEKKIQDGKWTHAGPDSNRLRMAHLWYFPCKDLCTIDRLWLKYSNGRFGFSVQKRIMSEIGNDALSILVLGRDGPSTLKQRMQITDTFDKLVGWYTPPSEESASTCKTYKDFTFSINAPYGHLPSLHYDREKMYDKKVLGCFLTTDILHRLSSCGIAL
ncbi:GUN4 domain-containing protein [Microcoleus sp. Z1_B5]|uniref:GUN4 domain-containing protein n=1 Tax=Microcoleus sp. Z1_B5 TaxID=3055430 RepID=UPI002FD07EFC